jgi:hypothetical protein
MIMDWLRVFKEFGKVIRPHTRRLDLQQTPWIEGPEMSDQNR